MRCKTCGKYIQENKYKILSESAWFWRRCEKHLVCFWFRSSNCCSLTKRKRSVSQGSVATLFRWVGKHLNYCIANLFRTMCTQFYQNGWFCGIYDNKHFGVLFFSSQCIYSVWYTMDDFTFRSSLLLGPKFGLSPKLSQKVSGFFCSDLVRTLDWANRSVQS